MQGRLGDRLGYATRLMVFLLISLGVHLFVLRVGIDPQSDFMVNEKHAVEFVSRSAAHFISQPDNQRGRDVIGEEKQSSRTVSQLRVPRRTESERAKEPAAEPAVKSMSDPTVRKRIEVVSVSQVPAEKESLPPVASSLERNSVVSPPVEGFALSETVTSNAQIAVNTTHEASSSGINRTNTEKKAPFQKALPRYDLNPLSYPESALRRRQQGTVHLEVLVRHDGSVGDIKLLVSSGFKSLDRAAQKAVRRWQFKPALSFGHVVESRVVVPVDFVLSRK